MGKNFMVTESQLKQIVEQLDNQSNPDGNDMAKQQLFTIAVTAYKMWEELNNDDVLEDWMSSKITQSEQSMVSVFKAFMYEEVEEKLGDKTE